MWVLITIILKLSSAGYYIPYYDELTAHETLTSCTDNMNNIYTDLKKLKANYPVNIELKTDDDNTKYIKFSYKPDYTKPIEYSYYHCKKLK